MPLLKTRLVLTTKKSDVILERWNQAKLNLNGHIFILIILNVLVIQL